MKTILYWEGKPIIIPNPLNIIPIMGMSISAVGWVYIIDRVVIDYDDKLIHLYPTNSRKQPVAKNNNKRT